MTSHTGAALQRQIGSREPPLGGRVEAVRLEAGVQFFEELGRRGVETAAVPGHRGGAGHGPQEALRPAARVHEEDRTQEHVAGQRRRIRGAKNCSRFYLTCIFLTFGFYMKYI